jgi:hypothetical protein
MKNARIYSTIEGGAKGNKSKLKKKRRESYLKRGAKEINARCKQDGK